MFCASLVKSTQMLVVFIFTEWQNFCPRSGTLYMIILIKVISRKNISDLKTNLHADIISIKHHDSRCFIKTWPHENGDCSDLDRNSCQKRRNWIRILNRHFFYLRILALNRNISIEILVLHSFDWRKKI